MTIKEGWKGRFFEDFEIGDVYEHPLGRTITSADNVWFTSADPEHCADTLRSQLREPDGV